MNRAVFCLCYVLILVVPASALRADQGVKDGTQNQPSCFGKHTGDSDGSGGYCCLPNCQYPVGYGGNPVIMNVDSVCGGMCHKSPTDPEAKGSGYVIFAPNCTMQYSNGEVATTPISTGMIATACEDSTCSDRALDCSTSQFPIPQKQAAEAVNPSNDGPPADNNTGNENTGGTGLDLMHLSCDKYMKSAEASSILGIDLKDPINLGAGTCSYMKADGQSTAFLISLSEDTPENIKMTFNSLKQSGGQEVSGVGDGALKLTDPQGAIFIFYKNNVTVKILVTIGKDNDADMAIAIGKNIAGKI